MISKLKTILEDFKADKESNLYKAIEHLVSSNNSSGTLDIQNKYDLLFKDSPLAYQLLDTNGKILDINTSWLDLMGYSGEEVIGKRFIEFIHSDYKDHFNTSFQQLVNDKNRAKAQLKLKKKGGEFILAQYESCVFLNNQGNFKSTLCSFRDVTYETSTLKTLKESEEKFKNLIYNQGEGIGVTDKNEVFTFSNPAADRLFGVKKGELIGKSLKDFLSIEEQAKIRKETQKRKVGKESNYELKITNLKGEIKYLLVTVTPNNDKKGNYISSFGIFRDITKRKKIEQALIEGEEKFKAITNSAQDAIILINENGNVIFWNKAATDIFQYKKEETINKNLHQLIAPEIYKELYTKGLEKFFKTGKGKVINEVRELTAKRKDGTEIPVELSLSALKINNKWHSVGIVRDISTRKKNEEILASSEERFRTVFEMNTDLIGIANMDTATFFKVNPAFTKVLGYSEKEFVTKSFLSFIHPDDIEKTKDIIDTELKHGKKVIHFVNRYKSKSGEYKILDWKAYPVADKKIMYAVAHDITRRTEDERRLKESEERFKLYIITSPIIILISNRKGQFTFANPAASQLLGYTRNEFLKMAVPDVHHEDDLPKVKRDFEILNKNGRISNSEYKLKTKQGELVHIILEGINLSMDENIAFCIDITDRKQYESKLQELNATKDKFFSIIAHDLRAPMNNMVGFSEVLALKHQSYSKEKLAHMINNLYSSAKQTYSLLENLLIWSMSQRKKLNYHPQKTSCEKILFEIISEMEHIALGKNIQLDSQTDCPELELEVDKNMIHTVLRNLISNAIKFTKEGGKIGLGCKRVEKYTVEFFISDTGVGIPKENIDKLFKIDHEISTPGTKDEQGTGLGLILCKEFVERHGGKIWVKSKYDVSPANSKSGSTFYFTIPFKSK